MADSLPNRRQTLKALSASVGITLLPQPTPAQAPAPFTLCLNMSTIRGQKLGFVKELETAAAAGFRSVEIWIDTLQTYLQQGGTLADARQRIDGLGLRIENAIGFAPWIVNDDAARVKGLDQLKREMEMLSQLGCRRIAAPPAGATNTPLLDLRPVAERYRAILDLGQQTGVIPQLELWGFATNLSRLSEVLYVAVESGQPSARVLLDVYHLFKGGSGGVSLPFVGKPAVEVFHLNDYPASATRETVTDADRVYPGDGVAPIRDLLKVIKTPGKSIVVSLELFNKSYYAQDALLVAKTGLAKMQAVTAGI
ncbi:MAG: sugar phosphate isomerase/epimerase [Bacteroidetes bacterium]|nr:sugar phosphate isomerase/epimerase [Fibrella sp.]